LEKLQKILKKHLGSAFTLEARIAYRRRNRAAPPFYTPHAAEARAGYGLRGSIAGAATECRGYTNATA
jgi:hypothetical protein